MFSHSLKVIKLLIVLASSIWRRDKRKKEDLIFFLLHCVLVCARVHFCAFGWYVFTLIAVFFLLFVFK